MQSAPFPAVAETENPAAVRILLAADNVAVRLTLEALLAKSGYRVDSAASAAEAMEKLEVGQYALVLCDFRGAPSIVTRDVLKLARMQDYRPATAYLTASGLESSNEPASEQLYVEPVEVPALLTDIAELIGNRAAGRARRAARRRAG